MGGPGFDFGAADETPTPAEPVPAPEPDGEEITADAPPAAEAANETLPSHGETAAASTGDAADPPATAAPEVPAPPLRSRAKRGNNNTGSAVKSAVQPLVVIAGGVVSYADNGVHVVDLDNYADTDDPSEIMDALMQLSKAAPSGGRDAAADALMARLKQVAFGA